MPALEAAFHHPADRTARIRASATSTTRRIGPHSITQQDYQDKHSPSGKWDAKENIEHHGRPSRLDNLYAIEASVPSQGRRATVERSSSRTRNSIPSQVRRPTASFHVPQH